MLRALLADLEQPVIRELKEIQEQVDRLVQSAFQDQEASKVTKDNEAFLET